MFTTQEIAPHAIVENDSIKNFPALPLNYYYNLALLYAENGFYVFPIQGNKFPYKGFEWTKRASNNPEEIKKMWQEYPNGVPALYCRPSNIVVIDIDHKPKKNKYGFVVFDQYVTKLGKLAKTVEIFTRSDGKHLYYRHNPDIILQRGIEDCIDIQTNHYCVCGGVYTPEGSYRFRKGHTFEDIGKIPELSPAWLEFLTSKPKGRISNNDKLFYDLTEVYVPKNLIKNKDVQQEIDKCQFLQYYVEHQKEVKESLWWCMIARLAMNFPDEIIHKLSASYDRYSYIETQDKIDRYRRDYGNRISCYGISQRFPSICKGCRFCK